MSSEPSSVADKYKWKDHNEVKSVELTEISTLYQHSKRYKYYL